MKLNKILLALLVLLALASCKEKNPSEEAGYNAFFVYPETEKKVYIGTVTGLSSCKYVASDYYNKRRKYIKGKWDYICCLRNEATGEECVEKHRYGDDN